MLVALRLLALVAAGVGAYVSLVRGALTVDLGIGRRKRTTVGTVAFECPHRLAFRLVRGPVPHVVETFGPERRDGGMLLVYTGELGTDLWRLGQWWGDRVAATWERAVAGSLDSIRAEAERRRR
jgi:hypothetical protein